MIRYYYLSPEEVTLLRLFHLCNFITFLPSFENFAIKYDFIDDLARTVYVMKNKSGKLYKKLVSFVDRLQEILEYNASD